MLVYTLKAPFCKDPPWVLIYGVEPITFNEVILAAECTAHVSMDMPTYKSNQIYVNLYY